MPYDELGYREGQIRQREINLVRDKAIAELQDFRQQALRKRIQLDEELVKIDRNILELQRQLVNGTMTCSPTVREQTREAGEIVCRKMEENEGKLFSRCDLEPFIAEHLRKYWGRIIHQWNLRNPSRRIQNNGEKTSKRKYWVGQLKE